MIKIIITIFPIFTAPMTLVGMTVNLYKLYGLLLLNLPYVRSLIACMYIIVSIKRLTKGTNVILCTELSGKELHE